MTLYTWIYRLYFTKMLILLLIPINQIDYLLIKKMNTKLINNFIYCKQAKRGDFVTGKAKKLMLSSAFLKPTVSKMKFLHHKLTINTLFFQ